MLVTKPRPVMTTRFFNDARIIQSVGLSSTARGKTLYLLKIIAQVFKVQFSK